MLAITNTEKEVTEYSLYHGIEFIESNKKLKIQKAKDVLNSTWCNSSDINAVLLFILDEMDK